MNRYFNKSLIGSLVNAHLFLGVIFLFVIAIEIIIPMENVALLVNVEFYKNLLSSPILWVLYVVVIIAFVVKSLVFEKAKK